MGVRSTVFVFAACLLLGGCASTAHAPASGAKTQATKTTASWTRVGMSRVLDLYLKPGRPFATEFQTSSSELNIFVLTQKPLVRHVLLLRTPPPNGAYGDKLTVVSMQSWQRSMGPTIAYVFTAKSVKPGAYRLVLKGEGAVFALEVRQR